MQSQGVCAAYAVYGWSFRVSRLAVVCDFQDQPAVWLVWASSGKKTRCVRVFKCAASSFARAMRDLRSVSHTIRHIDHSRSRRVGVLFQLHG